MKLIRPIITDHSELRIAVLLDCSLDAAKDDLLCAVNGADQSFKNSCDVNIIMAQYAKTGMLPQNTSIPARFIDNTTIPSLEHAFDIVNAAYEAFFELPPTIRKLMDNDPSKLENFIADDNNRDLLIKNGILVDKTPREVTIKSDGGAVDPAITVS